MEERIASPQARISPIRTNIDSEEAKLGAVAYADELVGKLAV
jgi:hypothetical protein